MQVPAGRRAMRVYAAGQKLEYIWADGQEGKEVKVNSAALRTCLKPSCLTSCPPNQTTTLTDCLTINRGTTHAFIY